MAYPKGALEAPKGKLIVCQVCRKGGGTLIKAEKFRVTDIGYKHQRCPR